MEVQLSSRNVQPLSAVRCRLSSARPLLAVLCLLSALSVGAGVDEVAPRKGLGRFLEKVRAGREVRVAYLGGSITEQGDNATHRGGWRVKTTQWLRETYPQAKIVEIGAGIGGTGSDLGVFRLEEDVLSRRPDLLFVEFACNDGGDRADTNRVLRTMEGIVRQTWRANPETDIAFAYTVTHAMTNTYLKGGRPAAARADEAVAAHYGIPSVDFGPRVVRELAAGRLYFGQAVATPDGAQLATAAAGGRRGFAFAVDGVHPSDAGHDLYFASVKRLFASVEGLPPADHAADLARPPLRRDNFERARLVRLTPEMQTSDWARVAPTGRMGWAARVFKGEAWMATRPGARLAFRFKGTACGLYDVMGPDCARIRLRVDGRPVGVRDRFDDFCTYYRRSSFPVAADLPDAVHTVELEIDAQQPDRRAVAPRLKDPDRELASPRFDGTRWIVGRILLVGELCEDASAAASEPDVLSWRGRNVVFLGDSITDPAHIGCRTNYWGFLAQRLGLVPHVFGQNGCQMSAVGAQLGRAREKLGEDIDAVFVFMGTNDFNRDVPQGAWFAECDARVRKDGQDVTRRRREFALDATTFRGRLNLALKGIKESCPQAQVVLLTPLHRGFAQFGATNVQPDERYANARGLFIHDYVRDVRTAGELWSVPVIDLFAESGLLPTLRAYDHAVANPDRDRLHPSTAGHERLARVIEARLRAMPSTFH